MVELPRATVLHGRVSSDSDSIGVDPSRLAEILYVVAAADLVGEENMAVWREIKSRIRRCWFLAPTVDVGLGTPPVTQFPGNRGLLLGKGGGNVCQSSPPLPYGGESGDGKKGESNIDS